MVTHLRQGGHAPLPVCIHKRCEGNTAWDITHIKRAWNEEMLLHTPYKINMLDSA